MRKDWEYGGRKIKTVIQWKLRPGEVGFRDVSYQMVSTLQPKDEEEESFRVAVSWQSTEEDFSSLEAEIAVREFEMNETIDDRAATPVIGVLSGLNYYAATEAPDVTPFDEYPEFQ